jgi:hypothetical protein
LVTVLRADGFRVVIYINDHLPAHVHVFGSGEAKIDLLGPDGTPDLVWADNLTRGEVRRAMRIVAGQQSFLLRRWEGIHGGDD